MSPLQPGTLDAAIRMVVGSYTRATVRGPWACQRCAGSKTDGFTTCYPCGLYPDDAHPDCAGFGTYASPGDTAGRGMRGYKATPPTKSGEMLVFLMLAHGYQHRVCAERAVGAPIGHFALVPSTNGTHPPPLGRYLPAQVRQELIEVPLYHQGGPKIRDISHELFSANTLLDSPHVLVLDDTWVTGGNMLSAVHALRKAGAGHVTSYCVARWVNFTNSRRTLADYLAGSSEYDTAVCPFGITPCAVP